MQVKVNYFYINYTFFLFCPEVGMVDVPRPHPGEMTRKKWLFRVEVFLEVLKTNYDRLPSIIYLDTARVRLL